MGPFWGPKRLYAWAYKPTDSVPKCPQADRPGPTRPIPKGPTSMVPKGHPLDPKGSPMVLKCRARGLKGARARFYWTFSFGFM